MTIFGQVVTNLDVEAALAGTIKLWLPDYLAEVGEQKGYARGSLPMFRSYVPAVTLDRFDEDQIPSCVIIVPGTLDQPQNRQGAANARWSAGIGCIVSGKDREGTRKLASTYTAAVRTLLLQKPSLGGFAQGLVWMSERYDALPEVAGEIRTFGAGVLQFGVDVNAVSKLVGGPMQPTVSPTAAPADWPLTETIAISVTKE